MASIWSDAHEKNGERPAGKIARVVSLPQPAQRHAAVDDLSAEIVRRTLGNERWRVAADIHDSVIQLLVATLQRIHLAERAAGADNPLGQFLADARRFTETAVKSARAIIEELVSRPTQRSILEAKVRETLRRLEEEGHAVAVHVGPLPDLSSFPKVEQSLAGVIGEAVTNCARHAGAFNIWVEVVTADGVVTVTVRDDGSGFDVDRAEQLAQLNRHFGLYLIREWARFGGGRADICSTPGVGTTVNAYLPTPMHSLNGEARYEDERDMA
jgi:two-component system vancomycin resistance sensor histidine kinase VraS